MVANLLPGLREIRAPLISGYLWLIFLFLVFHSDLPTRAHAGDLEPLFDLADRLSTFGIAAVSGIAAYLVGSAIQELIKLGGRIASSQRPLYGEAGTHLSEAGQEDIHRFVALRLQQVRGKLFQVAISPGEKGVEEEPASLTVERELPLVRTLLLGERPELVREIDRLQAEADLRITVAFPLLFLAVFLAGGVALGWLAVVPAALLLLAQGHQRQREAGDLLAKALRIGKADAPALESLEASADVALGRVDLEEELDRQKDQRHPMTEFRLGCLKANGEEFEAALVCLRFAAENDVVRAHAEIGDIHERREEFDEAEQAYRDGHARGDKKARQRLTLLLSYLARGEEALETAERDGEEGAGKGLQVDVPRERNREADYRRRTGQGDAKAAINLGLLLRRRDDLAGARDAFKKATELDPSDSQAWKNLGFVAIAGGHFDEAAEAQERALGLEEAQLGPDHLSVAATLGNLGAAVAAYGQFDRALELHERSLAIKEEQLEPDHLEIAITLGNIGNTLCSLGRYERSQVLLERALAIKERQLPHDHLSIAMTLSPLAGLMQDLGRYEHSQELRERSLAIKEKQLGEGNFEVAIEAGGLGRVLTCRGAYKEAQKYLDRAWALGREQLGEDDFYVGEIIFGQGELCERRGELEPALERYERSVAIGEKRSGPEHFFVASRLSSVGRVRREMESYAESEKVLRRALGIAEGASGKNAPTLGFVLRELGLTLLRQGSPEEGREKLERAVAIQEESMGSSHPELAVTLKAMAEAYGAVGDAKAQRRTSERARMIRRENGIG